MELGGGRKGNERRDEGVKLSRVRMNSNENRGSNVPFLCRMGIDSLPLLQSNRELWSMTSSCTKPEQDHRTKAEGDRLAFKDQSKKHIENYLQGTYRRTKRTVTCFCIFAFLPT